MKNWAIPAATVQKFAANDYVSACTATIDCNVVLQDDFAYYFHEYGKTIECEGVGGRTFGYYTPCGAKHEVMVHGELVNHTFTHGLKPQEDGKLNTNIRDPLTEPVECYVWFEMNEDGTVHDVHATLTRDGFEANLS